MRIFSYLISLLLLQSCANLYKERSYVTDVNFSHKFKGTCSSKGSQNKFSYEGKTGTFRVSLPVHYDYWWTGPLVIPLFPKGDERKDPSFINIKLEAASGTLKRDDLLKSEILISNTVEPVLPINVLRNRLENDQSESFTVQFEAPKLVDIPQFRLKLPSSMSDEVFLFKLATDTHYVPLLPVALSDCVVD